MSKYITEVTGYGRTIQYAIPGDHASRLAMNQYVEANWTAIKADILRRLLVASVDNAFFFGSTSESA